MVPTTCSNNYALHALRVLKHFSLSFACSNLQHVHCPCSRPDSPADVYLAPNQGADRAPHYSLRLTCTSWPGPWTNQTSILSRHCHCFLQFCTFCKRLISAKMHPHSLCFCCAGEHYVPTVVDLICIQVDILCFTRLLSAFLPDRQ